MSARGSRRIRVGGHEYRWKASREADGVAGSLAVELADLAGQRLVVQRIEYDEALKPGLVARIIEAALADGWNPEARAREHRVIASVSRTRHLLTVLRIANEELASEPAMALATLRSASMLAPRSAEIAAVLRQAEGAAPSRLADREPPPASLAVRTLDIGLSTEEKRACEEIETRVKQGALAQRRGWDLTLALLQDPHDLALRLVYADWLQARGDPRGEYIALSCARGDGPPSERELELGRTHGRRFQGILALAGVFVANAGFPERGRLVTNDPIEVAAWTGHPRWATVRELELPWMFPNAYESAAALVADPMLKMQSLHRAPWPVALRVCAERRPTLRTLRVDGPTPVSSANRILGELARSEGAAELAELELPGWSFDGHLAVNLDGTDLAPLESARFASTITSLKILTASPAAIHHWLPIVGRWPRLSSLVVENAPSVERFSHALTRNAAGVFAAEDL